MSGGSARSQTLLALLVAAGVALLRRPLLSWVLLASVALGVPLLRHKLDTDPWSFDPLTGIVLLVAAACVAYAGRRWVTLVVWLLTSVLFAVYSTSDVRAGWVVGVTALVVIADSVGARRRAQRALQAVEVETAAERARRQVLEERARIARDLHDVVAHRMSLVVVRAQTAAYRLPGISPAAQAELDAIAVTAREALNEVRSLLGVLRSDDAALPYAPQQGLGDASTLIEQARSAGVRVDLVQEGTPRELRPAVDLAGYRILQEALANVARHAPQAHATVTVGYTADGLLLEVVDDGPGGALVPTGGHGLLGMRERAAAVGGDVVAEPGVRGFSVLARLPYSSTVVPA